MLFCLSIHLILFDVVSSNVAVCDTQQCYSSALNNKTINTIYISSGNYITTNSIILNNTNLTIHGISPNETFMNIDIIDSNSNNTFIDCTNSYFILTNITIIDSSSLFTSKFYGISRVLFQNINIVKSVSKWVFNDLSKTRFQNIQFIETLNISFTVLDDADTQFINCRFDGNNIINHKLSPIIQITNSGSMTFDGSIIRNQYMPFYPFIHIYNGLNVSLNVYNTAIYDNKFPSNGLIIIEEEEKDEEESSSCICTTDASSITNYRSNNNIKCGDKITDATIEQYDINYYELILPENDNIGYSLFISTCGSLYDTFLYLYDEYSIEITSCDDCGRCRNKAEFNVSSLNSGTYFVGIGGYSSYYGTYTVSITCYNLPPTEEPTAEPTPEPTLQAIPSNNNIYIIINKCNISNNYGYIGTIIYSMTTNSQTISNNDSNTNINIISTVFKHNRAKLDGGIIYLSNGNISIQSSIFQYNSASLVNLYLYLISDSHLK